MTEELIREIIEKIKEKAYIPNDLDGEEYREERIKL